MRGDFARRLRAREPLVGYWLTLDAPPATERIARVGYDYVVLDAQHGTLDQTGLRVGLSLIDAGARSAGIVRVEANDPVAIGRALDLGAAGVIVPLVDDADEAAAAVTAARYPPQGRRSYGPMRWADGVDVDPPAANAETAVLAMIETAPGLDDVEAICATPGLDGIYIGPVDLTLGLGGVRFGDPAVREEFDAALARIRTAAAAAGVAAGIHTADGASAAQRLAEGFTFASVACDLDHLERAAAAHLEHVRA